MTTPTLPSSSSSSSSSTAKAKPEQIVKDLARKKSNKSCFDCGTTGVQQAVNLSTNTFVCSVCSGLLRKYSHKIKTITMASFTPSEVENLEKGGNKRAKKLWLGKLEEAGAPPPPKFDKDDPKQVQKWMDLVYVDKKYYKDPNEKDKDKKKKSKEDSVSDNKDDDDDDDEPSHKKKSKVKKHAAVTKTIDRAKSKDSPGQSSVAPIDSPDPFGNNSNTNDQTSDPFASSSSSTTSSTGSNGTGHDTNKKSGGGGGLDLLSEFGGDFHPPTPNLVSPNAAVLDAFSPNAIGGSSSAAATGASQRISIFSPFASPVVTNRRHSNSNGLLALMNEKSTSSTTSNTNGDVSSGGGGGGGGVVPTNYNINKHPALRYIVNQLRISLKTYNMNINELSGIALQAAQIVMSSPETRPSVDNGTISGDPFEGMNAPEEEAGGPFGGGGGEPAFYGGGVKPTGGASTSDNPFDDDYDTGGGSDGVTANGGFGNNPNNPFGSPNVLSPVTPGVNMPNPSTVSPPPQQYAPSVFSPLANYGQLPPNPQLQQQQQQAYNAAAAAQQLQLQQQQLIAQQQAMMAAAMRGQSAPGGFGYANINVNAPAAFPPAFSSPPPFSTQNQQQALPPKQNNLFTDLNPLL